MVVCAVYCFSLDSSMRHEFDASGVSGVFLGFSKITAQEQNVSAGPRALHTRRGIPTKDVCTQINNDELNTAVSL